ncbi:MAG: lactate utilization protein [bacterium]
MKSEFGEFKAWYYEKMLLDAVKALQQRNFDAAFFATSDGACEYMMQKIPADAATGIGGSVTIRELGIIDKLKKRGNKITEHWKQGMPKEKNREIRKNEGLADYYLTSANAITVDGDIINIDGIGNRVAHMIYGPENVIIIAGYNKIVSDIDEGILRSKEIAAVMNAKRIGTKTPCATTGKCIDCNAPGRICRVTTIIQYRPWQTNIQVLLINESLGF